MKQFLYNLIFFAFVIGLFFVGQLVNALTLENFTINYNGDGYYPCSYRGGFDSECKSDFNTAYSVDISDMDFPFVGNAKIKVKYKSNYNSNFYIAPEWVQFRVGAYKFNGYDYTDYEFTIVARDINGNDTLAESVLLNSNFYLGTNRCSTEFPTINGKYGNTVYLHCSSNHSSSALLKIELDPLSTLFQRESSTSENYVTNYVVFGVHGNVNVSPKEMPIPDVTFEEVDNNLNVYVNNFNSYTRFTSNPNELLMKSSLVCKSAGCKDINPASTIGQDTFKYQMTRNSTSGNVSYPLDMFVPGDYDLSVRVCYTKSTDNFSTSEIYEDRCSDTFIVSYSTGNFSLPSFGKFRSQQDNKDMIVNIPVLRNEDMIKTYLVRYAPTDNFTDELDFHEVTSFQDLRLSNLNYGNYRFDYMVILQDDREYFYSTAFFRVMTPEEIEEEQERNFFEEIIYRFTHFMNDLTNLFVSLIIPSNEEISAFFSHFKDTIEDQFGFLSLPITWILEILNRFYGLTDSGHYVISWPSISVPNFDFNIIQAGSFDLAVLLENTTIKTFHDLYILVTDALIVLSFINYTLNVMNRIFGGDVQEYEITTDSTQVTYNERDLPSKVRNTTTISHSRRKKGH